MDEENQGENEFVEFGRMLESLRVRKGWTQVDAAAHLGVARNTYIAWETGKRRPSDKKLQHIAATLKLSQADGDELNRIAKLEPPKLHNFPFSRNPFFTGRERHLDQLGKLLKDNDSVALTQPVSISGLPGIGKTQLALEYAHRCYPHVYRTVLWVDAANETTLVSSYDKLAHLLELPDLDERDLGRSVEAVKGWLERHTNWLLIMDNADNLQLARSFFPVAQQAKTYQGRILLTTRSQKIEDVAASKIDIDKMAPEEGLLFLLRRSHTLEGDAMPDTVASDIRATAAQVVVLLDGHPLALDQAGAYIEDNPFVSFAEYIHLYNAKRSELLRERGSLDEENDGKYSYHPATVVVTFELCFEKAHERCPMATDILRFCAFLHPDAIPAELFQHDDGFKLDAEAFKNGIRALRRYSLLKVNSKEKTCSLHRLVQDVVIDGMSADLQNQYRERVAYVLNTAFFPAGGFEDWRQWHHCERLLPHSLICKTWPHDELTMSINVEELLHKAGCYLLVRGDYSAAEPLLARAVLISEKHFGIEHPYTAYALNNLALLYMSQGKVSQSEVLFQNSTAILEKELGAEHPETAKFKLKQAFFYITQDKYEQAEPLLKRALSILEKELGAEHPETAKCLYSLGFLYLLQEKYEQGEPLIVQALSIQMKHLGTEYPDTVASLSMMGNIYLIQGKIEQAELLQRRALKIYEEHLGAEHPGTALPLFQLAAVLHVRGKFDEAQALYRRAENINMQRLGATHPVTQQLKSIYMELLYILEHDEEAPVLEVDLEDLEPPIIRPPV